MINDRDFQRLLENYHPDIIDSAEETIYAMRPDLTLAYFNRGWTRFAGENGGEPLISLNWTIGCCVQNAIATSLRPFFAENFAKCLRERRPWEHQYECSSADVYRAFIMTTYPLGDGEGLLVVNSLVRERSHMRTACEPIEALYMMENGLINQCCHCRRVRRCGSQRAWDWVPDWVRTCPPNTTHGLCEPCFGFHYPKQRRLNGGSPKTFRTLE